MAASQKLYRRAAAPIAALPPGPPSQAAVAAAKMYRGPAARAAKRAGIPVSFRKIDVPRITSAYRLPAGVAVNKSELQGLTQFLADGAAAIARLPSGAAAVVQAMGQRLVDLHLRELQRAEESCCAAWERTRHQWRMAFRADREGGGARAEATLRSARAVLDAYGQDVGAARLATLKDVFTNTGAGDHPAIIHFIAWIGQHLPANEAAG